MIQNYYLSSLYNFLSKEDIHYDNEMDENSGEIITKEGNEQYIHSYYYNNEPDNYFDDFEIIYKEKRQILIGNYFTAGRTCIFYYIAKKP
ncbi:MAG: hypothetical protein ACFFB6_13045 [Promethearchaeota archaeon]